MLHLITLLVKILGDVLCYFSPDYRCNTHLLWETWKVEKKFKYFKKITLISALRQLHLTFQHVSF